MTRAPTFLLFFAVVLAVLGGMHYYLWARLVRDTGLPGRRALLLVFALAAVAVPLAMLLARRLSFRVTRGSFAVLFTWTHAIGGLSENDFILAGKIDRLPRDAPPEGR